MIRLKYDGYSDQEIKDMIGIISESADNVYNLLDNLLNWSRAQKGKHKLHPQMTDLVDLINNKIELLNFQALHKNIRIEFGSKSEAILPELDPDLMNVVIQNLLTNAIKFTPSGGKIWVESVLGKGSTFFIKLPLTQY